MIQGKSEEMKVVTDDMIWNCLQKEVEREEGGESGQCRQGPRNGENFHLQKGSTVWIDGGLKSDQLSSLIIQICPDDRDILC